MEVQLRLVVHRNKDIYDDLLVTHRCVSQYVKQCLNDTAAEEQRNNDVCVESEKTVIFSPRHLNNKRINSYAVSLYICNMKNSLYYRQSAMKPLQLYSESQFSGPVKPIILITLRMPEKQFLDYKWGEIMTQMALERREVDHAMSWLSTLGGAFSALGEQFQHCAQMAGKISIHQFKLALRLGDPLMVARCKLYAALSIIQQGNLRLPRQMIKDIFDYAVSQKDTHLQRMCKGVWAKLQYCYKLKKQRKQLKYQVDVVET